MPLAVTHFIIPALIVALFRDWYNKKHKTRVPLHYVLIAGLAGVLPDIDIAVYGVLRFFANYPIEEIHRTLTHSLFFPLIFVVLALVFHAANIPRLGKHKLHLPTIFWIFAFGTFMHILLDGTIDWYVHPFLPFSNYQFGLNLLGYLPAPFSGLALPFLDGVLLIAWLVYLELRHKISDFI